MIKTYHLYYNCKFISKFLMIFKYNQMADIDRFGGALNSILTMWNGQ